MFSKAAKNAAPARAHLTMNDYAHPNISRHSSTNTPLNHITGNTLKRPASHSTSIDQQHHNKSARRSNSGLARVLSSNNGWDDCVISNKSRTNQAATTDKYKSGPYNVGDSFEEDYNLEEKQLTAHDAVSYPDLSRLVEEDALPPSSWDQIPWTSSPVSHFQPKEPQINLNSFRHNRQAVPTKREEPSSRAPVKAASRRKLPWGPGEEEAKTPKGNSGYGWDMSASLMKKQKNTLREINSKRVKTTEKENSEEVARDNLKKSRVSSIFLSDEQRAVLAMVLGDESKNIKPKSIFFTGSAGTGKSVLLREIIAALRKQYHKEPDRVAITASTGLAACNIGGITLHSFAGIGLGNSSTAELIKKIKRNQKAKHRWLRTKVLIMDEVSMLDGDLYDKLEEIARTLKNNGRAFGGIQVIMTGDFFQLPPVPEKGKAAKFAFHANTWSTTIEKTIALNKVFRQKDPEFASMLNEMREGRLAPRSIARFRSLSRELRFDDDLEATELFATRGEVDRANSMRLSNLDGETRIFEARDGGAITDREQRDRLLANVMAPERISLKVGSQVMLIKNYDDTLVNGSLGKVIGFMSETEFGNYHDDDEAYLATQAPVRKTNQTVVDLAGAASKFPVVRFSIADGTTRDMLCHRETWSIETPTGEVSASRSQIPLILAWALSIHKAQGQTLERVKVNLSRAFERGQAYVALSRATSMAGLQVIGFDPKKVMAHEAVRTFYAGLSSAGPDAQQKSEYKVPGAYADDDRGAAAHGMSKADSNKSRRFSSHSSTVPQQQIRASTVPRQLPKTVAKPQLPKASTLPDMKHPQLAAGEDEDAFWDSQFPDDDF